MSLPTSRFHSGPAHLLCRLSALPPFFSIAFVRLYLFMACCLLLPQAALAADTSAFALFYQIPPSIFDNTYLPLSEDDKERLLEKGYSSDWVLTHKTANVLHFVSLSEEPNSVTVQVYRAATGGIIALGANTPDACTTELWRFEDAGGLIPYEPEAQEPDVSDYFNGPPPLSQEITTTFQLCLCGDRLEAKPFFWSEAGLVPIVPNHRVLYSWNGTSFVKAVINAAENGIRYNATLPGGCAQDALVPVFR